MSRCRFLPRGGREAPDDDDEPSPPNGPAHGRRGCSICGDEGLEATVLRVMDEGRTARVLRGDGDETDVALDLLEQVGAGDRVIVHLGFAIARVREDHE